ncbi:MAG: long-chain fatty acid--CoA ligase [Zetaproteobacteria bacterium]|nr:long-chain fatty acid--CoA ligase [Zetaproteobacteria bacterium]
MLSHSPCFGLKRAKDAACLSDLLFNLPDSLSKREMLKCRQKNGIWQSWTLEKVKISVLRLAAWLQSSGVSKGDRVGILGHNCVPWMLADMAVLRLGAVAVPAYFTDAAEKVQYIFHDAQCSLIFFEPSQKEKLIQGEVPMLPFDGQHSLMGVVSDIIWDGCLDIPAPQREDLATLIYTSGTTGKPKGVMLTHGNILADVWSGLTAVPVFQDDVFLSFLPLSHAFERTVGHFLPIACGAEIAYAEDVTTLMRDMFEIKPTVVISVPRLYEKIYTGVQATLETSWLKHFVFQQAQYLGLKRFYLQQQGKDLSVMQAWLWQHLDVLVHAPLRAKLGGHLRLFISGGAALSPRIANFLLAADILVLPGYGLSETSPVLSVNVAAKVKSASVGPALSGVSCELAGDGELLVKGDMVMQGYWQHPEWNQGVLDDDGWLHTGDVARIDEDGYIFIVDRKKELLVLSNGENVPPALVEQYLCHLPCVEQAMVVGEGQAHLVALLVVDERCLQRLWKRQHRGYLPLNWKKHARVHAWFLKRVKKELSDLASYMQVRHVSFVDEAWSQENDCLTPTLKLKRHVIQDKYAHIIQELLSADSLN